MRGKGGGIGPHNSTQPRAPKNFNPALIRRAAFIILCYNSMMEFLLNDEIIACLA